MIKGNHIKSSIETAIIALEEHVQPNFYQEQDHTSLSLSDSARQGPRKHAFARISVGIRGL